MNDVTESICISAKSFFDGCQDCNAETAEEHIGIFFFFIIIIKGRVHPQHSFRCFSRELNMSLYVERRGSHHCTKPAVLTYGYGVTHKHITMTYYYYGPNFLYLQNNSLKQLA